MESESLDLIHFDLINQLSKKLVINLIDQSNQLTN